MSAVRRVPDFGEGYGRVRTAFEALADLPARVTVEEALEERSAGQLADLAYPEYAARGQRRARPRQSFLRSLQRHKRGQRTRWGNGEGIRRLREAITRENALARQAAMAQMLGQVERRGVTVVEFEGWIVISPPHEEHRRIRGPWPIRPDVLRSAGFFPAAYAGEWYDAAVAFFRAFFRAYGLGETVFVSELEELVLRMGAA